MQRPEHSERIERTLRRIANAVGNYVGGALLQASIAGLTRSSCSRSSDVPFAGPLAVLVFVFDLIPVSARRSPPSWLRSSRCSSTSLSPIIWVVFAIVYQQVENYLIQPQIQKRATKIEAFVILVAVLFGSTLFGILGAVLAVPAAATLQITLHEYLEYPPRDPGR